MHTRFAIRTLSVVALLCALAGLCWSQALAGGSIEGTVTDNSGAVVTGVMLKARNVATGANYSATSDQAGLYIFPLLPVGRYEISAEKSGFAAFKAAVTVSVGGKLTLPVTFRVAGSTESINVSAEAPLVETTRTAVSTNINERSIRDLPVNGRNFLDFTLLTPGVTKDPRGGDLSFAGQRGTLNSMTVDGSDNNNSFYGQAAARTGFKTPYQFSQDSVQEFQVATNGYSAEIGRAGGAVINVVTRSGSNEFHGGVFEFYRDQSLNAYDPIQKQNFYLVPANAGKKMGPKAKYHFNQFGGNLGGPIWKNRAFFFVDIDDQRNTVPNIITGYSTPANPNAEQAAAIAYLAARNGNYNKTNDQNTYLFKTDFIITPKHQLSARWNRQRFTAGNQENANGTSALEHTGNSFIHTDTINLSLTSTLSPKTINVLRVSYLKDREPGSANTNTAEAAVKENGTTLLTVGRNDFSPRETTINQQQYTDIVTQSFSRHTVKAGGEAVVSKIKNFFPGNFYGNYTFNSLLDFGCSLMKEAVGTMTKDSSGADFKACAGPTYLQAFGGAGTTGPETHPDTVMPAFFVQDDIRVSRSVTLNLGLRYDAQLVKQSGVGNATALAAGFDTSKQSIKKNEIAPRIGFAWDAFNDSKMIVRGGYGLFYGTTNSMLLGTAMSNNGINVATYTFAGAAAPFYPNTLCGTPGSALCTKPAGGSSSAPSIYVVDNGFQNPVIQQANLGVELALSSNLSLSMGALHVKGDHIQRTADMNLGTPTNATVATLDGTILNYLRYPTARPNTNFQRISAFQSNASSNYNGLVVELKKRFSHGVQASAAYTWSHVLDTVPDATSVVPGNAGDDAKVAQYPTLPLLDRGNGNADLRHRLAASYVWEPKLNVKNHFVGALVNGWATSGIVTIQSGLPYSSMVTMASGNLLNGGNSYNVRVPGVKRNTNHMPATYSFDPRIARSIRIYGENAKLQLFAEAFNLFNHFNVTGVKTNAYSYNGGTNVLTPLNTGASAFGLPTTTSGQRIVQLGAKFVF
jgi:hypothetical protein